MPPSIPPALIERLKSLLKKTYHLCENGPTAQARYEVSGSAAAPCSRTSRSRSGSRPAIRCGGSASWRIRPSIASIPPSVSSTPQKAGPQFLPSSCCWPRCCRRSTAFDPSGCCWSSSTTTCCSAGLWDSARMIRSGTPPRMASGRLRLRQEQRSSAERAGHGPFPGEADGGARGETSAQR